jgi:hypothetical protein
MKIGLPILFLTILGFSSGCQTLPLAPDVGQLRGLASAEIRERYRTFHSDLPDSSLERLKRMTAEIRRIPKSRHPEYEFLALKDTKERIWYSVAEYPDELGQEVMVAVFDQELHPRMHWSAPQIVCGSGW